MFHVGQKVECIADEDGWVCAISGQPVADRVPKPRGGAVYLVSGVVEDFGGEFLSLREISGFSFASAFFRPIVERELERLREIAADPPAPALAPSFDELGMWGKAHV